MKKIIFPQTLSSSSTIILSTPSYVLFEKGIANFVKKCVENNFEIVTDKTFKASKKSLFSLSVKERVEESQLGFNRLDADAVFFGRGGYGMSQIIDKLDFSHLRFKPKWVIGFSDITLLHLALFHKAKIVSIHGPMVSSYEKEGFDKLSLNLVFSLLKGEKLHYSDGNTEALKSGETEGRCVGGSLSMIAHAVGSEYLPDVTGCILVLEDVGEYLYSIERMLFQLKRAKVFDKIKGLVLGNFTEVKELNRTFGKNLKEIFLHFFLEYDFPICYNFPIGHGLKNIPFKHGAKHRLIVKSEKTELIEL